MAVTVIAKIQQSSGDFKLMDVIDLDSLSATDGQVAKADGAGAVAFEDDVAIIQFVIDGGGSVITTGIKPNLPIDFNCEIEQVTLLADVSGSIVIDIWKDTYNNYPPLVGDSITAAAKPTISGALKSKDATLTGWSKTITAGDILRFNLDSVASFKWCVLALKVRKT